MASATKVFGIGDGKFNQINEVDIAYGMETIFARGEYLYLGANDAMYIFSIADPDTPSFVFRYQHISSCDPVVVQGNRAYVTLRSSGGRCPRNIDALEIIDISDPYNPRQLTSTSMLSPHGLGIDNSLLFLCEGEYGIKIFDIRNDQLKLLSQQGDFFAYDVIARQGVATVTGEDGIFQFSYTPDGSNVHLMSKIPVNRGEL